MESILTSVKQDLGIIAEYKHFDGQIIRDINTVLMTLSQIGIGSDEPIRISSEFETWESLLGNRRDMEAVKTYVSLQVRMLFDPPANSAIAEAINRRISELEWRLNSQYETKKEG
jgi:hypothetical protein